MVVIDVLRHKVCRLVPAPDVKDIPAFGLIVMVIVFEVAGLPETQVALEVITTETTSLLIRVVEEKVGLLVPVFTPFNFHWYEGAVPPLTGVAVKVTEVPAQIAPEGASAMLTLAGRFVLTTMVIVFDVAGFPETHVAFEVITTETTSLLIRVVEEKVGLLVPAFIPFTFHWYEGVVPPLAGVAVKVTDVPGHMAPEGRAAILTLAGRFGLTTMVTVFDVAGFPVTHVAFEVITTETTSLLIRVVEEKVGLFVPAFTPFTFHWYDGVAPPLAGVAVKVTEVPAQIAPEGTSAILTLTGRNGLTTTATSEITLPDPSSTVTE